MNVTANDYWGNTGLLNKHYSNAVSKSTHRIYQVHSPRHYQENII